MVKKSKYSSEAQPVEQPSITRRNIPKDSALHLRRISLTALLLASTVVLARFIAIRTPIISISFSFVPIMLAGMILGWKLGIFVATLADLIGAILFPSGSFFIGYTLTAALTGLLAGLCLYRPTGIKVDRRFIIRLIVYVIISTALLHGCLNTFWIILTTEGASQIIVPVRIAKQLLMAPIEFLTILALAKTFASRINQLFFTFSESSCAETD